MQRRRVILIPIVFSAIVSAQNLISDVAGIGSCASAPAGDGGPAISATLCRATGAAVDPSGNIYFSDSSLIRKIAPSGTITTIGGNGIFGTAGNGGPALSANLGNISQVAIDPSGQHLCFADSTAVKIRCINLSTGVIQGYGTGISTFGGAGDGGNVANASFADPVGSAFDSAGNLYVSDFSDNRVRRVDAVTGVISTFAGPGPGFCCAPLGDGGPAAGANLYEPGPLYSTGSALYISDQGNFRVRRVDYGTGIITTVAGNGDPSDSGSADGGPATLAGITPRGIALDSLGDLFIASGGVIRQVNPSGIITTIAGQYGVSGSGSDDIPAVQTVFGGLTGLAWDSTTTGLLISDVGTRVRAIFFTPPTATTLVPSANPAVPGAQITLQATVSPTTATGSVRFYQDITLLASVPLTNAVASLTWTAPLGGSASYALRAVYGGDLNDNLSSSTVTETVQQAATTTALVSNPNPSTPGQAVTFTATVSPAAATGTVNLVSGNTVVGSATLSGGVAKLVLSNLPAGTNSLYAWYTGTPAYLASTSSTISQNVLFATSTSLSAGPNPSTFGAAVTLTATVTPSTATGIVQFYNGSVLLGSANLAGGTAQLILASLPPGSDSLSARYAGDLNNGSSSSAVFVETINKANTSTTLSASPAAQSAVGQLVTFTATVNPGTATGTIQFLDGSTAIGSAPVNNGTAVFVTSKLAQGSHSIAAVYSGDSNFSGSRSAALTYRVKH